jgi:hypothetical protein
MERARAGQLAVGAYRLSRLIVLAAFAVGCSGGGGAVAIKFTVDGAPLPDADVALHPAGDGAIGGYAGKTGSDGTLLLRPHASGKAGVVPGKYKATVERNAPKPGVKVSDEMKNDPEQLRATGLLVNTLPPRYADVNQTPLNIEVRAGTNPPVTLDVTTK